MLGLNLSLSSNQALPFSPRKLFLGGARGVWYDPSDLLTLFQDSAGTFPVTGTGQPVGLMLDKSQSSGVNLAPSTSSLSGWSLSQTGGTVTTVGGGLFLNTTGTGLVAASFGGLSLSARYLFEFEVTAVSGVMYLEFGAGGAARQLTVGKHRWCVTGRTTFYVRNAGAAATSGSLAIRDVSVRLAPGNHASQNTTTARPVLEVDANGKYGLRFDGVDDCLNLGVLDMSSASAAGYFGAIAKLSDTLAGMWYSHSTLTASGSVRLLAPANAGQASVRAGFYSSSGLVEVGGQFHAAPITLTLRSEIEPGGDGLWVTHNNGAKFSAAVAPTVFSADGEACLGAQVAASSRSTFFNGRLYSLIIVGRKSNPSEQVAIETFLRNKSGAY